MTELERVRDSLMIAAHEFVFGSGNDALAEQVDVLAKRYCALVAESDDMVSPFRTTVDA